tara:strand:+ start:123 stop:527 length:405 start_codon:yes stop_codon:yes gene_type:complete
MKSLAVGEVMVIMEKDELAGVKCGIAICYEFEEFTEPCDGADALGNIGFVYRSQGKLEEALKSYQAELELHRQIGNLQGQAKALRSIGIIYSRLERKAEALEMLEQALAICLKIGARAAASEIEELIELLCQMR